MTDNDLKTLLSDYVSPTADDGFSDAVMRTIQTESETIDLSDYVGRPDRAWRSWLVALVLGLIGGLLWNRAGIAIPDIAIDPDMVDAVDMSWGVYALMAICVASSLLFVELDSV